ncbi:hypothetical protein STSO111631_06515 [Stackebrandtia soli]
MIPAAEKAMADITVPVDGDAWTLRFIALVAGLDPLAQGVESTIDILTNAVGAPHGFDRFLSALCAKTLSQASLAERRDIDAVRMHVVNAVLFGDIVCCARSGQLSECTSWTSLLTGNRERTVVDSLRAYFTAAPNPSARRKVDTIPVKRRSEVRRAHPRHVGRVRTDQAEQITIPRHAATAALHLFGEGRWLTPQQREAATALRTILADCLRADRGR